MKIKSRPDDFQVEELTAVVPGTTGVFSYYRLEKKSVGTPEAIQQFCRALRIDPRRVRYGGLKDRHAQTIQYLTIEEGPERHFKDELIQLSYLGKVNEPYGPTSFQGNRFGITIRDLEQPAFDQALAALEEVKHSLVGNYFDDQRFGSVNSDQQYVARALIDGNDELALKLALTSYYEHDRSTEKKAKQILRQNWGNWKKASTKLQTGYLQEITWYLQRQTDDYRGAFAKIPFFLRNMYLSAFQSHLWNRILTNWLTNQLKTDELVAVKQKYHTIAMPRTLTPQQLHDYKKVEIPLPSSRAEFSPDPTVHMSLVAVLQQEGLTLQQIKLKHYKEPFFSKGNRSAFYSPEGLRQEIGWDKLNKGHRKLKLIFELPRGCYATLLVKRITAYSSWHSE